MTATTLSFTVSDANGKTIIEAKNGEISVKKIDLPTAAFDVLSQLTDPTPNKEVQQLIAHAMGWGLNEAGRCPKAAALLERVTHGYGVFNGVIAVMVASSVGKSRFFSFNENLAAAGAAPMLTRQKKAETVVVDDGMVLVEAPDAPASEFSEEVITELTHLQQVLSEDFTEVVYPDDEAAPFEARGIEDAV